MHHFFPPLTGENPTVLILGTFPSPVSRGKCEYYGNPQNKFWRIIYDCLGADFDCAAYEEKKELLTRSGIALWDVIDSCDIEGALDSSIRNPVYNTELPGFIEKHRIKTLLFNGRNAYIFYKRGIDPNYNGGTVLPSTSPANARISYAAKLAVWKAAVLAAISNRSPE